MDKRESVFEKAAEKFSLPADILANLPRIEVIGCREILIENHKGIMEYRDEEININGGKVIIKLKGEGLTLKAMSPRELLISGNLFGVEFVY